MFTRRNLLVLPTLVAIALLATIQNARADHFVEGDLKHHSAEDMFDDGAGAHGTIVSGCIGFGCPALSFTFGNPSGDTDDLKFKVEEDIHWDLTEPLTEVRYTLTDFVAGNITSFHIDTRGMSVHSIEDPPLGLGGPWSHSQVGDDIWWTTSGAGLPFGANGFAVVYDGLLEDITYAQASFDVDHGGDITFEDWVVSTVPVPGAVLLGAMGLGLVGWVKRRLG